jgi:putative glycerol-1-phosphate prenyltransferase
MKRAILFLSLISGRNADLLIGNHVHVAPLIKAKKIEAIPTGYMLIESGKLTTAQYMSSTLPIPHDKADVAVATAIAGELLGLKVIYLDGGSGAENHVSQEMIARVKSNVNLPLIVGGGIRTVEDAKRIAEAGADLIVVGNAAEEKPDLILEMTNILHNLNL